MLEWTAMADRVLVTGAAGFIGSHVVKLLLEEGRSVRATARNPEKAAFLKKLGPVDIVTMDLLDLGSVRQAVKGCDDVIHCAAALYIGSRKPQEEVVDPSIKGTQNLVNALSHSDVKRIVHTSSVSAVRATRHENGHTFAPKDWCEDATLKNNPYGLAKAGAERVIRNWAEGRELRLVSIHPSIVFGKPLNKRHLEGSMSYLKHFLKGPPFVLDFHINFVDVEDVARAHVAALIEGEDRGRYIIHSGGMWMRDIGLLLKTEFPHRKWATRNLPHMLAYLFAFIHPKLTVRQLRDNLGTVVNYDASTQSDLLNDVKSKENIITDTMRILLEKD